jgi:hypothetical protein
MRRRHHANAIEIEEEEEDLFSHGHVTMTVTRTVTNPPCPPTLRARWSHDFQYKGRADFRLVFDKK